MLSSKADPLIGKKLDDYSVDRLIAKGGMGRVYEGTDQRLGRKVAIKVIILDEDRASELMTRFEREARAISKLDGHPNIVTVYRYGEEEGVYYMAMQYIQGQSLAEYSELMRKESRKIEPAELIHIFRQIAGALDYAHDRGVIHRDIKPANIMLEGDASQGGMRKAILMDFGLVMQLDTTSTLGSAFGTPRYIAPEQAVSSQQAGPQSDIYSMGIVIYELLAGRPPFSEEETPMSVALSHITKPPPSLKIYRPDLPLEVVQAIMRSLEKKPENRYARAVDFIQAIEDGYKGIAPIMPSHENSEIRTGIPSPVAPSFPNRANRAIRGGGSRRALPLVGAVVVIALIIAGILFSGVLGGGDDEGDNGNGGEATQATGNVATAVPTTAVPATAVAAVNPTATTEAVVPTATIPAPTATTEVVSSGAMGSGQLLFTYTGATLAILNSDTQPLKLTNIELRQDNRLMSLRDFGASRLNSWQPTICSYITNDRNSIADGVLRPAGCQTESEPALVYSNTANFVWMAEGATQPNFQVFQDGNLLGECVIANGSCSINGVQRP